MNTLHNQDSTDYPYPVREQVQRAAVSNSSSLDIENSNSPIEAIDSSISEAKIQATETILPLEQNEPIAEAAPVEESTQPPPPVKRNWLRTYPKNI